jgi:hypothetical protein
MHILSRSPLKAAKQGDMAKACIASDGSKERSEDLSEKRQVQKITTTEQCKKEEVQLWVYV